MPPDKSETASMVLMVVVVNRGKGEKIASLFVDHGVTFNLLTLGKGTADKKILVYLGLGETEKDILYCTMPLETSRLMFEKLNELNLSKPGTGIAFSIPISGVADAASCKRLQGAAQKRGGISMELPFKYNLIIAVTGQGYMDEVMDVAKSAGASGGTVVHARGVGLRQAEKFFGISIQPEKEMIFILAKQELCQGIMETITEKMGLKTDAKTIVFSLPVNGVAGLPSSDI